MPQVDHFGVIDANKVYHHKTLAEILGRRERWIEDFLRKYEVPCVHACRGTILVSGQSFLRAIERAAQCLADDDSE